MYSGARFQHLLRSLPFGNWRGGISVVQGVGWRQSKACGNAPRLVRTRPFAICSLGSYLMTLPHWNDARSGQQRKRLRGILCETASRSPVFSNGFRYSDNLTFIDRKSSQCCPSARPIVELLRASLRMAPFAYKPYVEMVPFQPGGSRWLSELQSVEL